MTHVIDLGQWQALSNPGFHRVSLSGGGCC